VAYFSVTTTGPAKNKIQTKLQTSETIINFNPESSKMGHIGTKRDRADEKQGCWSGSDTARLLEQYRAFINSVPDILLLLFSSGVIILKSE
jgi:hypothetical protein